MDISFNLCKISQMFGEWLVGFWQSVKQKQKYDIPTIRFLERQKKFVRSELKKS